MEKPKIFISYHKKDEYFKDLLVKQLGVLEQESEYWAESQIEAGEDRRQKMEDAIEAACVAILLVSCDSLSPRFILDEGVKELLLRKEKEDVRIIPLIVKDCAWETVKWLARMQVRPVDGKPLEGKKPARRNTDLKQLVVELSNIITRASGQKASVGPEAKGEPQDRAVRFRPEPARRPAEVETRKAEVESKSERLKKLEEELASDSEFARRVRDMSSKYAPQAQASSGSASPYQREAAERPAGSPGPAARGFKAQLREEDHAQGDK